MNKVLENEYGLNRSSVRNLHPDFGHFDSNIRGVDVGGPATTSRLVDC